MRAILLPQVPRSQHQDNLLPQRSSEGPPTAKSVALRACHHNVYHEFQSLYVQSWESMRWHEAAAKVWPKLPLTVLVASKPSCSKEGQQEKQQQGPHADAMAGPNQFTTSLHSRLKDLPRSCDLQVERTTCRPGVWTPWNSFSEAARDKDCIGPLHRCHDKYHWSFITCRMKSTFFSISTACNPQRQPTAARIPGVKWPKSWKSSLTLKLPTLERRQVPLNLGVPTLKTSMQTSCCIPSMVAEAVNLTARLNLQCYQRSFDSCSLILMWNPHLKWAVWKLEWLLECPRNGRDVSWSLIWLTTSAKCHCSHYRLCIYNLSSEAVVRFPVKVLKTSQNRVLIIS